MTKSELIEQLSQPFSHMQARDVELAVKEILEFMAQTLQKGERI
ncbi:MAG: HU family DNA-binding protein, partial [Glaciecola sp.]